MTSRKPNQFPDFFTAKDAIPVNVTMLRFGKKPYWMSSVGIPNDNNFASKPYLKPYTDNDEELIDCGDLEDSYDIVLNKNGKFTTSFYVPSSLLSFIIGSKGVKLKALQRNTNTIIKIPRMNEKGDVLIIGDTERKVASARTQIAIIVAQRKERLPVSHFVGIWIDSEEVRNNFLKFQESILENPPRGVTKSVFQLPVKLHLTLVVMSIVDEDELNMTKKALESFYNEGISSVFETGKRYKIVVKGLEIMNDDPSNVNILYGKVDMESPELKEKLQGMVDKMLIYLSRKGLAKRQYDRVKLHLTLMNTSFKDPNEEKTSMDASSILEKYKDYYFGKSELKDIKLCIRGTTTSENGESKFYDSAITIPL